MGDDGVFSWADYLGSENISVTTDALLAETLARREAALREELFAANGDPLRAAARALPLSPPAPPSAHQIQQAVLNAMGALVPQAATQPVNVQGRPGEATAPRCPVHKTRMTYDAAGGHYYCTRNDETGAQCTCQAHPATRDLNLLRNQKYDGPVKVLVATTHTNTITKTSIFLMLETLGLVVEVTDFIDLTEAEAVQVNAEGGCKLALVFPRIEYAQGTS